MIVYAHELLAAADTLERGLGVGKLANGVVVTARQLRKAGEILRAAPQPVCNGLRSDMPGFIDDEQKGKSLMFRVGILPSHSYRIDGLGRKRAA